jgi:selenoprotein W-related protein
MNDEGLEIAVEYCFACNYYPRTAWMVNEILTDIQEDVKSLTLIPGSEGRFEWTVNGELVFSKAATDRFPEIDELKELVYEKLHAV